MKRKLLTLTLPALIMFTLPGTPTKAEPTPTQQTSATARDSDTTRQELANFDRFLDGHRELGEQLRKDPSLVNNDQFVRDHPELQTYLQDHPRVREEIKENPNAFMHAENRYERREDNRDRDANRPEDRDHDINRQDRARFDQFLDSHRETAEQLRKNPSLVNDDKFIKGHPALQSYLQDHPEVRQDLKQNPDAFMQQEARYDRREDNRDRAATRQDTDRTRDMNRDVDRREDRDINRQDRARFDQFLDSHRETAEQLRKNPSLVNDDKFVKDHPALQSYLQEHPEVRQDIKQNPDAFMQQEARYDRREDALDRDRREDGINRDRDFTHRESASFGEFLGGHSNIAHQLSKDPSLATNHEYLENHPELQQYLNAHPEVREKLQANPQGFVNSAQQFSHTTNNTSQSGKTSTAADPTKPKP
jgi:hypothetical protein